MNDADRILLDQLMKALPKPPRRFFGFSVQELAVIITMVVGLTTFIYQGRDGLDAIKWLKEYARKSDAYHTAQTGVEFYQGAPVSPMRRAARNFNVIADAHAEE